MPGKSPIKYNILHIVLSLLVIAVCFFCWLFYVLHASLSASLADAFSSIILLYIFFLCINYIPGFKINKKIDSLYLIIYSLAFSLVWTFGSRYGLTYFFPSDNNYLRMWKNDAFIRVFIGWLIIYTYNIIQYLYVYILQLQDEIHEDQQTQQLKKDAELFKLRQQLQPHFLFNSLNSINALIVREPKQARQMVQQLSDYLRNTIKKEDDNFIDFKVEMDDLRLYLAIEQVRFGHRLIVEEDVEVDCENIQVPPFLLQPLVENAIKYGLYGTTGTVKIGIIIKKTDNALVFVISNPYDMDAVATKGTGFGLESIKRRLYLLFARNDLLKIEHSIAMETKQEEENLRMFVATIIIPLKNLK